MSLKMESYSKWNVTKNAILLKLECHLNEMSLKLECHSKWNVPQNRMLPKMECHSNGLLLKLKFHSKWKTKKIEKFVNPKASKST